MAKKQGIKLNQIELIYRKEYSNESNRKKRDINDIPINNCALGVCYGVPNRIISNRKIYQLIESIEFHINDITNGKGREIRGLD